MWVAPERLAKEKEASKKSNAKQRAKPGHKEKMREYFAEYNQLPKQKAYRSEYYKQPEVRARYREKWATDPEMRERAREYNQSEKGKEVEKRYRDKPETKARRKAFMAEYWPEYHAERFANDPEYREACRRRNRESVKRNRDKINARDKMKYDTNPNHRMAKILRNRIRAAMRAQPGSKKIFHMEQLIGCSMSAFLVHIQAQFTEGMTISDLMTGRIHIDHHVPCARFDLTDPEQQLICFNFENLKPLWALENIVKSDKVEVDGEIVCGRELRKIIPFLAA